MSTKIGIIAEGPIDHALLPALLERIARDKVGYDWPVSSDDVAEILHVRKRGHGGVLETLRKLVSVLDTQYYDYAFIVILLDRRTRAVQRQVRRLLRNHDRFVLGIAIEEIEAWWLGDRTNTLAWAGVTRLPHGARYALSGYHAEDDASPKKTLDELTRISDRFDRYYGDGNTDMAIEFADGFWRPYAKLDVIRTECPEGYGEFEKIAVNRFRAARNASGWLF